MCGKSILYCQCGFKKIWIRSWERVISEPYEFMICCTQHCIGALEIWGWAVEWLIRARDHVLGSNAVMSEVMSIASGWVFTSIEFVKMPYLIKLTMDQKNWPSSERGCFYRMLLFAAFSSRINNGVNREDYYFNLLQILKADERAKMYFLAILTCYIIHGDRFCTAYLFFYSVILSAFNIVVRPTCYCRWYYTVSLSLVSIFVVSKDPQGSVSPSTCSFNVKRPICNTKSLAGV